MRLMAGLLLLSLAGCSEPGQAPVPNTPAASSRTPVAAPPAPAPAPREMPAARVVMDVMLVVGKTEAEVSALIGPPATCEDIHRARMCRYSPNEHEVMFVAGKADMVTVRGMGAVPFNADALGALGIEPASPDHADEHALGWQSIPGLEEITVFPGQGGSVDYVYVKAGKH